MKEKIKKYIDYLAFERRNAKNTYASYERDLNDYSLYLSQKKITSFDEVTRDDITKYLEKTSAST